MNNRRYRHRLLALSASILLGLSGLSSSAVDAAEVTVEQPAADTTVSQDTGCLLYTSPSPRDCS